MIVEQEMVTLVMVEENSESFSLYTWNMATDNSVEQISSLTIDYEGTIGCVKLSSNMIVCGVGDSMDNMAFIVSQQ
jgi:hypothetical protein